MLGKLSITCACSLWKYFIFAIIYLHEIYSFLTSKAESLPASKKKSNFIPWGVIYVEVFV